MIKFGIDLKNELFVFEADEEEVYGTTYNHRQIIEIMNEDFEKTIYAFSRFEEYKLKNGLYQADINSIIDEEDGNYYILKNIESINV